MSGTKLIRYDAARRALAEAHSVDEIKQIRDVAIAAQAYARQAKDRQLIDHATDIRFRAEREAGRLLREMRERGERARPGDAGGKPKIDGSGVRPSITPTIADLGVTKTESARWQQLAALTLEQLETRIAAAKKKEMAALDGLAKELRAEQREEDAARIRSLVPIDGKFRALVIDPPWDYGALSIAGRAAPIYATMSREQLLALDVPRWAEEGCHCYLWATNNFVLRAGELMAAWGFQYKTMLTWVKPRFGLGSYFRNSTEHVLFGVRGELRTLADDIPTHFLAVPSKHSEKPEAFYAIVRRASAGPYGEVFQRKPRDGFTNVFGSTSPGAELAAE